VIRSLRVAPDRFDLTRTMERLDMDTFGKLSSDPDIKVKLGGTAAVKMLWEVCQIPDFRQVSDDEHAKLCTSILADFCGSQRYKRGLVF
jgi:ATP-dependent RNA helicase SUPV3L1/SUV3